jgi:putative transposase
MRLRNRFVTLKSSKGVNNFFNNKQWLLNTPKTVRLSAVREATKNLKACFTNIRRGNISSFDLRFKSRKKEILNGWCLGLEKINVSKNGDKLSICPRVLGDIKYARKKQLHKLIVGDKPSCDPKIQKTQFGEYYLLLPIEKKTKKIPRNHDSIRSYDPGSKVYLSGYDPKGEAIIIGKGCDDVILSLLEKLDDLYSERSKLKGKAYKRINNKCIHLRKRIYNLKNELHHQVNNIVAKSSSLILYPKLATKDMTLKENRQLRTKTVRQMLNLGHCNAYEKLKTKCLEHGSLLLTVSEAYTTKTCSKCGTFNTCSNERIYKCSCGYKAERDLNGGQNILLRSLG